jgi:hypothetical protein
MVFVEVVMRIPLYNCTSDKIVEIANWLTDNIGEPEENVTWFWDNEMFVEDILGLELVEFNQGIKIYKDDPHIKTIAMLKWS